MQPTTLPPSLSMPFGLVHVCVDAFSTTQIRLPESLPSLPVLFVVQRLLSILIAPGTVKQSVRNDSAVLHVRPGKLNVAFLFYYFSHTSCCDFTSFPHSFVHSLSNNHPATTTTTTLTRLPTYTITTTSSTTTKNRFVS